MFMHERNSFQRQCDCYGNYETNSLLRKLRKCEVWQWGQQILCQMGKGGNDQKVRDNTITLLTTPHNASKLGPLICNRRT